jgi:hypothetical protein
MRGASYVWPFWKEQLASARWWPWRPALEVLENISDVTSYPQIKLDG